MLHMNELPLKKVLENLDGISIGPSERSGQVGNLLDKAESFEIVNFIPIESTTLPNYTSQLSSDQKYLADIIIIIKTGIAPEKFSTRSPGRIHNARWLTTANRILRLYISTLDPSDIFIKIVKYVILVYAKEWFTIKNNPLCTDGTKNLFSIIKSIRDYDINMFNIVKNSLNRNSFFAHSENVLLAMLADENADIRMKVVVKILQARGLQARKYYENLMYLNLI